MCFLNIQGTKLHGELHFDSVKLRALRVSVFVFETYKTLRLPSTRVNAPFIEEDMEFLVLIFFKHGTESTKTHGELLFDVVKLHAFRV